MIEDTKVQPNPVEIIKVQNGWVVRRSPGIMRDRGVIFEEESWVFETFEHLTEWLKKYYSM